MTFDLAAELSATKQPATSGGFDLGKELSNTAPPSRSTMGEIATGFRRSVPQTEQMAGQALQWASSPTGNEFSKGVYGFGKRISDDAKATLERPDLQLNTGEHNVVTNALAGGAEMLLPSVAAPLAVAGGLAGAATLAPELAVGAGAGLLISGAAGAVPMGMAQAQQTYENVKDAGGSDLTARGAGWRSGAIETLGETIGTVVGGKFVGIAGKAFGKAVAPGMAGVIEGAFGKDVWKPFAKGFVKTALVEVGTEMGQSYGEASVEKAAGVDVNPWEQAKAAIGPTMGMTMWLAPFGLHASFKNSSRAATIDNALGDPAVPADQRVATVEALYEEAKKNKVPDAAKWKEAALSDIVAGVPIRREAPTTPAEQAQTQLLKNIIPGIVSAEVVDGNANIIVETADGPAAASAPVQDIAAHIASGKDISELPQFLPLTDPAQHAIILQENQRRAEQEMLDSQSQAEQDAFAAQAGAVNRAKNLRGNTAEGVDPVTGALLRDTAPGLTRNQQMDAELAQTAETPLPATRQEQVQPLGDLAAPETITTADGKPFGSRAAARGAIALEARKRGVTAEKLLPQYDIVQSESGFVAVKKQEQQNNDLAQTLPGESEEITPPTQNPTLPAEVPEGETPAVSSGGGQAIGTPVQVPGTETDNLGTSEDIGTTAEQVDNTTPIYTAKNKSAASGYIARNKLQGTHEVREVSGAFEVVPKAETALFSKPVDQDSKASPARGQVTEGSTTAKVISEVKSFLGTGYDNLVRRGKLEVVQSVEQLPENIRGFLQMADFNDQDVSITAIYSKNGDIAGAYDPATGKVHLIADNITEGDAKYVMIHEAGHALLREDKVFMAKREKILSDFSKMKGQSMRDAYDKADEAETSPELRDEEALAYWLQEKSNHNHSFFKRVMAAIKAALMRLGIPTGRLTEADFAQMFTQGAQAWAQGETGTTDLATAKPEVLFTKVNNNLQQGRKNLATALGSLSNVKSKGHGLYVQYAPEWLSVTPLHTLVQTFGKTIHQIKDFAGGINDIGHVKSAIVTNAAELRDAAFKLARKGPGVKVLWKSMSLNSFNQMVPWLEWHEQDWVPKTGTMEERNKATSVAWDKSGMKAATGMTFMEAYREARAAYEALGSQELKDYHQNIVADIEGVSTRKLSGLIAQVEAVTAVGPQGTQTDAEYSARKKLLAERRKELVDNLNESYSGVKGAYMPLPRFGNFTLEYVDQEGFTLNQHFDSVSQRTAAREALIDAGVNPQTFKESIKSKQPGNAGAMPAELMSQIEDIIRSKFAEGVDPNNKAAVKIADDLAADAVDDMKQAWLSLQTNKQNSMHRRSVKGYNEDMLRGYEDYMQRNAATIAWAEHGSKLDSAISSLAKDTKEKLQGDGPVNTDMDMAILNDLRMRRHTLRTTRTGPIASYITKVATAWYMTSPSIALVQMSQLGILTLPKMAVKYGPKRAIKALSKGFGKSLITEGNKGMLSKLSSTPIVTAYDKKAMFSDPVVNAAFENIRAVVTTENRNDKALKPLMTKPDGTLKALGADLYTLEQKLSQVRRLTRGQRELLVLREAEARNLLDVSAAYEAMERTRGKNPDGMLSKSFNLAMQPMVLSELASRKTAILATHELATEDGKNFFDAMEDTAEVVNDTLFSYAKEEKGWRLQGSTPNVLLQFMHFRIMSGLRLAMLMRDSVKNESPEMKKAARKEFIGVMGMSGALAGVVGIPMASLVFAAANLVFGSDDEPYDAELEFSNWLREKLGETVADVVERGPFMLAGADISRRIGMGDIYGTQSSPPSYLHGKDLAAWWAMSLLGPTTSVVASMFQGYDQMMNKGNYLRGLETALPKPLRDLMKTYRVGTEGLKTGSGKKILADEKINPDELILMALGFNPDEISKAQTAEWQLTGIKTHISERRGRIIRDVVKGLITGDVTDAMDAFNTYNSKMPKYAIRATEVKSAFRKQLLGELGVASKRDATVSDQFGIPSY